jgi:hypothetical protein
LITTYGEGISKPDTNLLAFDITNASKDGNFPNPIDTDPI